MTEKRKQANSCKLRPAPEGVRSETKSAWEAHLVKRNPKVEGPNRNIEREKSGGRVGQAAESFLLLDGEKKSELHKIDGCKTITNISRWTSMLKGARLFIPLGVKTDKMT